MTPDRRQKLLVALAPALLVALAYVHLHARPESKRLSAEADAIAGAERARPARITIEEMERVLAEFGAQANPAETAQVSAGCSGSRTPAQAGELLASLLHGHRLLLVEDRSGGAELAGALPKPMDEQMRSAPAGSPARVRSLRFRGKYADVVALLGGIRESLHDAVVLKLRLAPVTNEHESREWTLVLWI
ncbi:MAG: hypothetical protein HUU15_19770 [Candidatus Brocadiae bacterium]|nr:hypothetical protein [Candidatus Brocadiia bacterium]